MDEQDLKTELFRMLDQRWMFHRSFFLHERGAGWNSIALVLNRHVSTVKNYYRSGREENKHYGTLHYLLSSRSRNKLKELGVDATQPDAPDRALRLIDTMYGRSTGLGRLTRDEILNAIDLLNYQRV